MRVWFKIFKDDRIIQDETIENTDSDTRTHKIFKALEEACTIFDFGHPVWLEKNIAEFKNGAKTRFTKDNFIEEIEFDYLEMNIIEED